MTEWEKKRQNTDESHRKKEIDDFWDVDKLLPERPIRRTPPLSRPAPTAVEVELTAAKPAGEASAKAAPQPVTAVPLTVLGGEEGSTRDAGEYDRPMPAPKPAPDPSPNPQPSPSPQPKPPETAATAVHYVPSYKRGESKSVEPLTEYQPDGVLLHSVKVYGWQTGYHYFDSFVEDAHRYDGMKPPKTAEKVSFFSYFPQYTQLNRRSEAWYLYWREYTRRGQYLDTDYAYVLLYLFELINLPVSETTEAMDRRDAMAKVWMAYRKPFPQLDHYMCEWLCDYCLIHELTAPVDLLAPALDTVIQESRLKEFYLSAAVRLPEGGATAPAGKADPTALQTARILMRHCCQYDYRKSKFASGEHKALFDSTIPAAVAHVLPLLLGANGQKPAGKPAITMLDSTVTRDAYTGALCSYRNKRRIEVSYTSFSRSHELRFLMGDMVKHVENRLRGWIGVRSKLSVMSLPLPLRDALDAYLNPLEPPKSAAVVKKKEEPRPAYEALYDLPRKAVSLEDAAAIEADSWETTRILVEAFEVADGAANEVAVDTANDVPPGGNEVARGANDVRRASSGNDVAPAAQTEENGENGKSAVNIKPTLTVESGEDPLLAPYAPFIKAALDGDSAALRAAAKALGKMPDALADEINALTADGEIGDIILEDDGMGGYTVIEEYREQVIELL
ncbi:MAG: TerB N-terminal domain-containing protein [Clostridia bacterium]|nr:TerB N-terminal domain-containing protein [Clostridia bacterium]